MYNTKSTFLLVQNKRIIICKLYCIYILVTSSVCYCTAIIDYYINLYFPYYN